MGDPADPHLLYRVTGHPRRRAHQEFSDGRLWDIDTGHELIITELRMTADVLLKVAVL